ncbi:hypothetical protein VIBNIFTn2_590029 [Vibrio nigripulchritudo FTn2]|nr:hypothetical protein VIBNIFTn2_590029 [Vibrio nigripulchritudo FTn2]
MRLPLETASNDAKTSFRDSVSHTSKSTAATTALPQLRYIPYAKI